MPPTHAVLEVEAFATLHAATDFKLLGFAVELPAWKTLHCAEPAIHAIQHPFDDSIRGTLCDSEESDLFAYYGIFAPQRSQMLQGYPTRVANCVAENVVSQSTPDGPDAALKSTSLPVDESVSIQLFFFALKLIW
jgi:hypothetical protein